MNALPDLPKQIKKREANFATIFRIWLKAHPQDSAAFELKQTTKPSIPFSCLEEHQESYLLAIKSPIGKTVRVMGGHGEPDYIYLRNQDAYVVIKFPGEFHIIPIWEWRHEKLASTRKSLTQSRSREIAKNVITL
jgi:penicillin-binding protein-related factor A (putative recombinase)